MDFYVGVIKYIVLLIFFDCGIICCISYVHVATETQECGRSYAVSFCSNVQFYLNVVSHAYEDPEVLTK